MNKLRRCLKSRLPARWSRSSTPGAYIARDEADIPVPQATDGPRKGWAKPVVDDWLEQRRRDPGKVAALLNTPRGDAEDGEDTLAPGLRTLWNRLTEVIAKKLWRDGPARRRWSRPHRNEHAVRNLSSQLAGSRRCIWTSRSRWRR